MILRHYYTLCLVLSLIFVQAQVRPIAILNAGWKYEISNDFSQDNNHNRVLSTKALLDMIDDKVYHELNSDINLGTDEVSWISGTLYLLTAIYQVIATRFKETTCVYGHKKIDDVRYAFTTRGSDCKTIEKPGVVNVVESLHKNVFKGEFSKEPNYVLCVPINSGGEPRWSGWVAIGPSKNWGNNVWCGPSERHEAKAFQDFQEEQETREMMKVERIISDEDLDTDGVALDYDEGVLFLGNDNEDGSNDLVFW